jgi:hypothetical protein
MKISINISGLAPENPFGYKFLGIYSGEKITVSSHSEVVDNIPKKELNPGDECSLDLRPTGLSEFKVGSTILCDCIPYLDCANPSNKILLVVTKLYEISINDWCK